MISYANMRLKPVTTTHKFEWNGNEIEVLDYLPIEDKYDLIMITLQKSLEDGYYNPIKIDEFFHLHLIYMYTNINFTEKQKEDEHKLYDSLKSNGLIDAFIEQMNEFDYSELFNMLDETKREITDYHRTMVSLVQNLITDMPKQAEAMSKILDNFDPDKYQNVINFAKAANGGREISE
jgi:hypothetical protein